MKSVPNLFQVIDLDSGVDHSVAVTRSGQVWSWGCAEQGQLGRVARFMSVRGGRRGLDTILAPQVLWNCLIKNIPKLTLVPS